MKIVVIGGTGLIGSKVVESLSRSGHEALAAAPNTGVNTITGEGLAKALEGAEVVVDVANSPSFEDQAALDFSRRRAGTSPRPSRPPACAITSRCRSSGPAGCRIAAYFRAKLVQEGLIKASPIPYTLIHATQFFEFLRGIAQSGTVGDIVRLPHARFQPMAAQDVAAFVAEAALAMPINDTVEVTGPDVFHMDEVVARVLQYDKDPRRVIADPDAPYFGLRLNDASLMPGPDARVGATGFDWWLANVPPPPKR